MQWEPKCSLSWVHAEDDVPSKLPNSWWASVWKLWQLWTRSFPLQEISWRFDHNRAGISSEDIPGPLWSSPQNQLWWKQRWSRFQGPVSERAYAWSAVLQVATNPRQCITSSLQNFENILGRPHSPCTWTVVHVNILRFEDRKKLHNGHEQLVCMVMPGRNIDTTLVWSCEHCQAQKSCAADQFGTPILKKAACQRYNPRYCWNSVLKRTAVPRPTG